MKRFDLWKLSLLNVFSCPVRSILTVLGFAIGVAAILAVLTLGEAGREQSCAGDRGMADRTHRFRGA